MPEPRLLIVPEMVKCAEAAYAKSGDMEAAIRAAFDGVPLFNYATGMLLDTCRLVVCEIPGNHVEVFSRGDDPEGFEALVARVRLTFDRRSRPRSLTVSGIEWPALAKEVTT